MNVCMQCVYLLPRIVPRAISVGEQALLSLLDVIELACSSMLYS